ncbi:hypothetical protein BC938DRAFT_484266 [Jimgerdemannia flammicorona]|uniref:Uncharacterized protein n=1 Tax=Jimgerdemannia flammicorona TaxID=994334 RepID=A0A433QVC0_9FUNG|nr:hypothetical protein BC938DRAFT_484266 [Jimgerdemannia flammicorona]
MKRQTADTQVLRLQSQLRLKSVWEDIIERYGFDWGDATDEIDLATGEIVVDRGHVRGTKGVKYIGSTVQHWPRPKEEAEEQEEEVKWEELDNKPDEFGEEEQNVVTWVPVDESEFDERSDEVRYDDDAFEELLSSTRVFLKAMVTTTTTNKTPSPTKQKLKYKYVPGSCSATSNRKLKYKYVPGSCPATTKHVASEREVVESFRANAEMWRIEGEDNVIERQRRLPKRYEKGEPSSNRKKWALADNLSRTSVGVRAPKDSLVLLPRHIKHENNDDASYLRPSRPPTPSSALMKISVLKPKANTPTPLPAISEPTKHVTPSVEKRGVTNSPTPQPVDMQLSRRNPRSTPEVEIVRKEWMKGLSQRAAEIEKEREKKSKRQSTLGREEIGQEEESAVAVTKKVEELAQEDGHYAAKEHVRIENDKETGADALVKGHRSDKSTTATCEIKVESEDALHALSPQTVRSRVHSKPRIPPMAPKMISATAKETRWPFGVLLNGARVEATEEKSDGWVGKKKELMRKETTVSASETRVAREGNGNKSVTGRQEYVQHNARVPVTPTPCVSPALSLPKVSFLPHTPCILPTPTASKSIREASTLVSASHKRKVGLPSKPKYTSVAKKPRLELWNPATVGTETMVVPSGVQGVAVTGVSRTGTLREDSLPNVRTVLVMPTVCLYIEIDFQSTTSHLHHHLENQPRCGCSAPIRDEPLTEPLATSSSTTKSSLGFHPRLLHALHHGQPQPQVSASFTITTTIAPLTFWASQLPQHLIHPFTFSPRPSWPNLDSISCLALGDFKPRNYTQVPLLEDIEAFLLKSSFVMILPVYNQMA